MRLIIKISIIKNIINEIIRNIINEIIKDIINKINKIIKIANKN